MALLRYMPTNKPTTDPLPDTTEPPKALRDARGRMLAPLPGSKPITSADARTLAKKRWDKYRRSAADAITDEAKAITGVTTPYAAWGVLNARLFTQIMDSDKPRGADLAILGRNIGATPRDDEVAQQQHTGSDTQAMAALGREALAHILSQLETRREVIEAEVTDDD